MMEDFGQLSIHESYDFLNISLNNSAKASDLLNQLYRIKQTHHAFNNNLKDSASNLYKLLKQDDKLGEFSVIKNLKRANMWVAYPVDYPRFVQEDDVNNGFVLQEGEYWHRLLSGEIGARTGAMPAIPRYRRQPFVAKQSRLNPLNIDQIFDDRYFALSNTFNLLNTLLLNN